MLDESLFLACFLWANVGAFGVGLGGYIWMFLGVRKSRVRLPVIGYPVTLAASWTLYWCFIRESLKESIPVLADTFARSVAGLMIITGASCLPWLSPIVVGAIWIHVQRRLRAQV